MSVSVVIYLVDLINEFLPPHEELSLGLALVPGAQPEVGGVELDPDEGGHVVAGVEHLHRLGEQVLQLLAVQPRRLYRRDEVLVQLPDGVRGLARAAVPARPVRLAVQRVGGQDEALPGDCASLDILHPG